MSKKRSRRNTKSFKKSRARAGIPRQDLRSGGRVGFHRGAGTSHRYEEGELGSRGRRGMGWHASDGSGDEEVHETNPDREQYGDGGGGGGGGTKPPTEAPPLYDETEVKAAKELGKQRTTGEPLAFPTFGQDPAKLTARKVTPEEHSKGFKDYKKSKDYDPLKYGDGSEISSPVMTQSADGQWWSSPQEAAEYAAWLQDQEKEIKTGVDPSTITQKEDIEEIADIDDISAEDARATTYTTIEGEAETGVGVGRPFTPEELEENWKASDGYQQAVEESKKATSRDTEIIQGKIDRLREEYDKNKLRLGRTGLANFSKKNAELKRQLRKYQEKAAEKFLQESYKDWEKTAPRSEGGVGAITYDAAKAGDLAATVGATGTVSKEPTAASADVTTTTAAQRDTEQEEAAKAAAAERPGRKLSPEEQRKRFLESDEYKKDDGLVAPTVMTQSSDGQWWPNPAIAESYDEWLNKQPEVTSEYAEGVTTDETYEIADDISEPTVATRTGRDIPPEVIARLTNLAQERGVVLEDLPEYKDQILKRKEQTGDAATKDYEDRLGPAPSETAAEAKYKAAEDVPGATKETITDSGEAGFATRAAQQAKEILSGPAAQQDEEQADEKTRKTFTTEEITPAEAKVIEKEKLYSFDPAQRDAQKGEFARKRANDIGVPPEEVAAQTEAYGMSPVTPGAEENITKVPAYEVAAT